MDKNIAYFCFVILWSLNVTVCQGLTTTAAPICLTECPDNAECSNCTFVRCETPYFNYVSSDDINSCVVSCSTDLNEGGFFNNYNTTSCDNCTEKFNYCNSGVCHSVNLTNPLTSKCGRLCGREAPLRFESDNKMIKCNSCAFSAYSIDECDCCVDTCPPHYKPDNRGMKCVPRPLKPDDKVGNTLLYIVLPVLVALVIFVFCILVVCYVCYRRRRKSRLKGQPTRLPTKSEIDDRKEKRPLTDGSPSTTPNGTEAHTVVNTNNAQARYNGANATVISEPSTPDTPDYENKDVIDTLHTKRFIPQVTDSPSLPVRMHQEVPVPAFEQDPPTGHRPNAASIKGYVNKEIIQAHNQEMDRKASRDNLRAVGGAPSDVGDQQEIYANVSEAPSPYFSMGNVQKASSRRPSQPVKSSVPLKPRAARVAALGGGGGGSEQELYLPMGGSMSNLRQGALGMNSAVPAFVSREGAGVKKPDYYNEVNEQEEYCNVVR